MKITCDQATLICDKNQYKEATFLELIKLNLHIWACKFCKLYTKQNGVITKACGGLNKNLNFEDSLTEQEKIALQEQIDKNS